ncbi:MAG: helix-turn-helix domain-containing protein [Nitrospinae bacterium]|nr:helix-turn-helix domain-containing protein [Nitrospinota bacterium]
MRKDKQKPNILPKGDGGPPTSSPTPLFKKKYISLKEAAAYLGIQVDTLQKWVQKKIIPHYKFPFPTSHPKFCIDELERYTNRRRVAARGGL